jgi:surface protein
MSLINNKYKILEKIGNGKFGIVYKGLNIKTNEYIAIKTETKNSNIRILKNETAILKYLYDHGSRCSPIVYWYGVDSQNTYLIMSFYNISLFDYAIQNTINIDKMNKIIVVAIDILETIHEQFVIHRDIKPQNFMLHNDQIFLIDFGFSTFYINENKKHQTNLISNNIIGTPKYISINIHDGNTPSRRDDLISLGYTKSDIRSANITPQTLFQANVTIPQMTTAKYTLYDILQAGFSLTQVKSYGFVKSDYSSAGVSVYNLSLIGFTKTDYTKAGFSPLDLINSGQYTLTTLMNTMGYTYADVIPAGCMPSKTGFIFDIATTIFNSASSSNYLWWIFPGDPVTVHPAIPIINTQNSFTDLSYSWIQTASTGLTTVSITWSSFTDKNAQDGLAFSRKGNNTKTVNILQYGRIPITSNSVLSNPTFRGFFGRITATDTPNLLTTTLRYMFYESLMTQWGNIGAWDVSKVTDFYETFSGMGWGGNGCNFNADISNWNLSSATNMSYTFQNNIAFNQPINSWNVSNVTVMRYMFNNSVFNQPLNNWNVSKVTDMMNMFSNVQAFQQDISTWQTNSLQYITGIFSNALIPISNFGGWNYTHLINMDNCVTNPPFNTPIFLLAINKVYTSLANNITFCLGTDPNLPLLNTPNLTNIINQLASKGYILVPTQIQPNLALCNQAGVSTTDLRVVGFTVSELITGTFPLSTLATAGYQSTDFTTAGYQITDLLTSGFTPTQLITSGFSVTSISLSEWLISPGFTYNFRELSFTIQNIISGGYPLSILINSDFVSTDYTAAGYTVAQLYAAGFSVSRLLSIGFQISNLLAANIPARVLSQNNITITQILSSSNYRLVDLSNCAFIQTQFTSAGYTLANLKTAGFSATQLILDQYTVPQIYQAGYSATSLLAANVSIPSLYDANVPVSALISNNVPVSQLYTAGYSVSSLVAANTSLASLVSANVSLVDLSNSGFTIQQMEGVGVTLIQFIRAGYTVSALEVAGYSASNFKDIGYSSLTLMNAGYPLTELIEAGYGISDLLSDGYTVYQLQQLDISAVTVYNAGVSLQSLHDASYQLVKLTGTQLFTISQFVSVGYTTTEFYNANYTASQIVSYFTIPQMKTGGYTAGQMLSANVSAANLVSNGYTATDFYSSTSYTVSQMASLGFTAGNLFTAGYSTLAVYNSNSYTIAQMAAGGYTIAMFYAVNVPALQLYIPGILLLN